MPLSTLARALMISAVFAAPLMIPEVARAQAQPQQEAAAFSLDGFRSARFGMDEDAVRAAIKADFGLEDDAIQVGPE
jgi:predicted component of type VI protein secretion system